MVAVCGLLALALQPAAAQAGSKAAIRGEVVDSSTGQPVAAAQVTLPEFGPTTTKDPHAAVAWTSLSLSQTSRPMTVEVRAAGYGDWVLRDVLLIEHGTLQLAPTSATVFAVIGDYGSGSAAEGDVASLVASWNPEFVVTTGDNNYPYGDVSTIDPNIGQFYSSFIGPYAGSYGSGASTNRFFPSLGNHDWYTPGAAPYLAYFSLPGNERYYSFTWGPIEFFALDSDSSEPDGIASSSAQGAWLQSALAASRSPWQVVYFHHPPYSSGSHGSTLDLRWPFAAWGADAVLAGHDHLYERLSIDGIPYFVNGLGGHSIYNFTSPLPGSQVRYNSDYGAMRVEATQDWLRFQFINRAGATIDSATFTRSPFFADVPAGHWARHYIEALYLAGYVAGCQATPIRLYCPDNALTRAESSVFVERGFHDGLTGPPYPTPTTPTFADVPPSFWGFGWIENLWIDGLTAGCATNPLAYCPDRQNTRAEASVFFLHIKNGAAYRPSAPTDIFSDVAPTDWFAGWVEAAYNQGLLPACQTGPLLFCPNSPLDRSWAAYAMAQAKGLTVP